MQLFAIVATRVFFVAVHQMELISRLKQNFHAYGYRGLLLSAKSRILPPQSVTRVKPPRYPGPVFLRTRSTDVGTYRQIFIDSEYDVDLAEDPKIIIDVGANVGYTALYFHNKYPHAKILAIEPESSNFDLLVRNVASQPDIIPIKAAIWSDNTDIEICDPGVGKWGFRTRQPKQSQHGRYVETVAGITLDQLLVDHGIEKVDVLKIDIEGAESEVFRNTSKWIDKVGVLMIELHDRITPGCTAAVFNSTTSFDYEYQHGETFFFARTRYVPQQPSTTNWIKRI